MKTLSLDLRERVLASYDEGRENRQQIADRYRISLGMVKKLVAQRKKTGSILARHEYSGRKPFFTEGHRKRLAELIEVQPDITLEEMRERLELKCSLPAIYYVLKSMNLTFKKNSARERARSARRQSGA